MRQSSFRPLELDDKRLDGTAVQCLLRRGQIDQVGVMCQRQAEAGPAPDLLKGVHLFRGQFSGLPQVGTLGHKSIRWEDRWPGGKRFDRPGLRTGREELDSVHAVGLSRFQSFVEPASNRQMSTE